METIAPISAFHGAGKTKIALMERVKKHVDSNQIRQGIYVSHNGPLLRYVSSMGAILYGSNAVIGENKYGIPAALMELQEAMFDAIEKEKCSQWPLWFLNSMRNGADLRSVIPRFFIWFLFERENPVVGYAHLAEDSKAIVEAVHLHRQCIETNKFDCREGTMEDWEPKMRNRMEAAKMRGDTSGYLALRCAFFSLYAGFSTGSALSDGLSLYEATVDGEMINSGVSLTVSIAAKELLRIIGER